jgi:hypothetical protein
VEKATACVIEVQKQLGVEAQDVAALSRTQTVGEDVEAMLNEIKNVGGSAPAAPVDAAALPAAYSAPPTPAAP